MSHAITIPAVVINLARSRDRRAHMDQRLKGRHLDYHFFEAVDGHNLTPDEQALYDKQAALAWMRRPLLKEEIGCAISHLRVYEWMLQQRMDRLLVMEDDITFKEDFFTALRKWDAWVPRDWDMINFATTANHPFSFLDYFAHRTGPKLHPLPILPAYTLTYCINAHRGAYCYVLTRAAAERLLSIAYPVRMVADWLTGKVAWHRLKTYTTLPPLTWTHNWNSAIRLEEQKKLVQVSGLRTPYARQARRWDNRHSWKRLWTYIRLGFAYRSVRKEWLGRFISQFGQVLNPKLKPNE